MTTSLPENFKPHTNQLAIVNDGFRTSFGSFTGVQYESGAWQVVYKDFCGDRCVTSTNNANVVITLK